MSDYNYSTYVGQGFSAPCSGREMAFRIHIDVAELCTIFGKTAFTGSDTVKLWKVPEHFHMKGIRVEVLTAGTPNTSTMDIGDVTQAAGWISNLDLHTVADTSSITYNSVVGGKIYVIGTDPYIVAVFDHAAATGTFDVVIWGTDTNAA